MARAKTDHFPLLDYIDGLMDELRELAPKAARGESADAVHDARVATRRIKAAIDLMEKVVSRKHRKPLLKITRTLRKRLGSVRDLDVMLAQLGTMKSPHQASAVDWITQTLARRREKAVAKAAADLPPSKVLSRLGAWWGLRQEILLVRDAVPSLLAESIHIQLDALVTQAQTLADPHLLRIAAKSLRYTLEMARAQKLSVHRSVLAHFKRIQDALGRWHDDVVLAERIMAESAEQMLAHHDAVLQEAALSLAATLVRRGRRQLGKLSHLWQRDGSALVQQIRLAFPLTLPAEQPASAGPEAAEPTIPGF